MTMVGKSQQIFFLNGFTASWLYKVSTRMTESDAARCMEMKGSKARRRYRAGGGGKREQKEGQNDDSPSGLTSRIS